MTTEEICRKYYITNYSINPDGSIDVYGDVNLSFYDLTELPIRFNRVYGNFWIVINQLTSLKSSPRWVGGHFDCSDNRLTSLEFSPEYVGGNFSCRDNELTDLIGSPKEVDGYFSCNNNKNLITIKGCSEKIGREFRCSNTPLCSIFNVVDKHFLHAFNFYKVIKDDTVNLKRLKYVMNLYDQPIDLDKIEKYYTII